MSYFKRVMYVDRYEDGVWQENAGFLKVTKKTGENGAMCLWMNLFEGVCVKRSACTVKIVGERREYGVLGETILYEGRGMIPIENMEDVFERMDIPRWEEVWLKLELDGAVYAGCILRKGNGRKETVSNEEDELVFFEKKETSELQKETPVSECAEIKASEQRMDMMKGDKWSQLWITFKHLKPFEDEREYLQLGLPDLVILSEQYYRMAENSFLRHGYYNYGHLVLTKMRKRGKEKVCLGVPGNYYEKEDTQPSSCIKHGCYIISRLRKQGGRGTGYSR